MVDDSGIASALVEQFEGLVRRGLLILVLVAGVE